MLWVGQGFYTLVSLHLSLHASKSNVNTVFLIEEIPFVCHQIAVRKPNSDAAATVAPVSDISHLVKRKVGPSKFIHIHWRKTQ